MMLYHHAKKVKKYNERILRKTGNYQLPTTTNQREWFKISQDLGANFQKNLRKTD
jgi:hypothetical protein